MSDTLIEVRAGGRTVYEFYPMDNTPVYGSWIESACGEAVLVITNIRGKPDYYARKFLNGDWLAQRKR